jgi:RloB-like protein
MPNRAQGRRRGGSDFSKETRLERRRDTREQRRSVLVVTNGESTEKDYFEALRAEPWVAASNVKLKVKFENRSPVAIVTKAAGIRDENEYDEAWVVCDADDFDVRSAGTQADRQSVGLAVSVPCFEVWLILHLAAGCPGFNNATQADVHLKGLLPTWDKTSLRFLDFQSGVFDAVARAKRLDPPPDGNPSTDVWRLIEALHASSAAPG